MAMKQHQKPLGNCDEWLTPPEMIKALGQFDLDPCASINQPWPTALVHFTELEDGLSRSWAGRVWCNPPWNRYVRAVWMRRMAEHGFGTLLVPAATETDAFERWIWQRAGAVCFVRSRPHFYHAKGWRAKYNCGTAIVLAAYGQIDVTALMNANMIMNWGTAFELNDGKPSNRKTHEKKKR